MTTVAWIFLYLVCYLVVGIVLRNHSPWGKKWYAERPTLFTLLWIVPAISTALFFVALFLAIVSVFAAFACIVISTFLNRYQENRVMWCDILVGHYNMVLKNFAISDRLK